MSNLSQLLVFDNLSEQGGSKVIEINPSTHEIVWSYAGTPDHPFECLVCGSNERLRNGNTLITDSVGGRALEVTLDGEVVWDFTNPDRAGDNDELIACLFEVVRLEWDYPQFEEVREIYRNRESKIDPGAAEKLLNRIRKGGRTRKGQ